MKSKVLNGVVIGCNMGLEHVRSISKNTHTALYGICDTDPERMQKIETKFAPKKAVSDWREFLKDRKVDFAVIATPDQLHLEMAKAFLKAGKHVLCEKPMALTSAECIQMIKAEKETGKTLMIGQVSRFTPAFKKAKKLIDDGVIGELYFIESEYAHDYSRIRGVGDWRVTPERHAVIGGGCHAIDLLRWIAGDPTEVYALSSRKCLTDWPVDDCSIAVMKFPNGVNGKVLTSIGCKRNYTMRSVFYGTRGTIICDNKSSTITLFEGEEIHPASGTRKFTVPQLLPVAINHHNTDEELAMFLDAVLGGKEVAISAMEGAATVAVCEAVVKSCECGMPIKIEYPAL